MTRSCPASSGGGVTGEPVRDGRGGGGGGYGGAGGRGEAGWWGGLDPPSCPGNYQYTGACVADVYGRSFGSNSDETIYMGSGGGAGSAYPKWAVLKLIQQRKDKMQGDEAATAAVRATARLASWVPVVPPT